MTAKPKARAEEFPFVGDVPDYGRQIPPPLCRNVTTTVKYLTDCYERLLATIEEFRCDIAKLVETGKLDPDVKTELWFHYTALQKAVHDATSTTRLRPPHGDEIDDNYHRIADHAKYVYALGSRDIAAMQYRLSELAGTGRLDAKANDDLQWGHCYPFWETLYDGTTSNVRDWDTLDWNWCWDDNTYSDGRQVMTQARLANWDAIQYSWPYHNMAGDGPINEHPWGSVCQIAPVRGPYPDCRHHEPIMVDLDELNLKLALAMTRRQANGDKDR